MKSLNLIPSLARGICLIAIIQPAAAQDSKDAKDIIVPASQAGGSPWRVRGGAMWRHLGRTSVNPRLGSGAPSRDFLSLPGGVGAAGSFDNRTYDDGFVNQGAATPGTGLTTNFSYQNALPIVGDNLVFLRSGGTAFDFPSGGRDGDDTEAAPYIEFAHMTQVRPNLEAGFSFNFSVVGLDSSIRQPLTRYAVTTRDTFGLGGVVLPQAPFTGSFAGPGPLIGNVPDSREQLFTAIGTESYAFESDTDLYAFALGSEIAWTPAPDVVLSAGAGVVLNYADWDAASRVPLAAGGTRGHRADGNEFLLGLYLKAGLEYRINERWGIEAFGRYDWNESLDENVGPAEFNVDLTGWSIGTGVTWRF